MLQEPIAVTLLVTEALEGLGITYLIGGSLASAVHGVMRATLDADLVVDLPVEQAEPLANAVKDDFYVDPATVRHAVLHHNSFNLIHKKTTFKVDVFIPPRRPFDQIRFARRLRHVVAAEPERSAFISTAEDMILIKLEWYRTGGEVSDRQWRDVTGIMKVQGDRLDFAYLHHWASELGLEDLLERALADADIRRGE